MPSYVQKIGFYDISPWAAQLFKEQLAAYKNADAWVSQAIICAGAFIKLKQQASIQVMIADKSSQNIEQVCSSFQIDILRQPLNTILQQCKKNGWALDEWLEFAVLCIVLVEQRRRK